MRSGHFGLYVAVTLGLAITVGRPAVAADGLVAPLPMSAQRPHFVCAPHAVFRSTAGGGEAAAPTAPLPCCNGRLACAQFLSTTTILHGSKRWHG